MSRRPVKREGTHAAVLPVVSTRMRPSLSALLSAAMKDSTYRMAPTCAEMCCELGSARSEAEAA